MSAKFITAMAAAVLLASTGLASAQTQAPRQDRAPYAPYNGYYDTAPNAFQPDASVPSYNGSPNMYPFPVTGQSGA
jgi:hypothetical protein